MADVTYVESDLQSLMSDREKSEVQNLTVDLKSPNQDSVIVVRVEKIDKTNDSAKDTANSNENQCTICNKTYKNKRVLLGHLRKFHSDQVYSCKECEINFSTHSELSKHTKMHSKLNVNLESSSQDSVVLVKVEQIDDADNCADSSTRDVSNVSQKIGLPENSVHCTICDKVLKNKRVLLDHMAKQHPDQRQYPCPVCKIIFSSYAERIEHRKTHQKSKVNSKLQVVVVKIEQIDEDEETFEHEDFNETQEVNFSENSSQCTVCKKFFKTRNVLMDHLRNQHPADERKYPCTECESSFATFPELRKHRKMHPRSRTFKCNVCDATFMTLKHLKQHEAKVPFHNHTVGGKRRICEVCHKSVNKTYLSVHRRMHAGEKSFSCSVCEKSFLTSNDLKRHENGHAGIKKYKCNVCKRAFLEKSKLRKHFRTRKHVKRVAAASERTNCSKQDTSVVLGV